MRVRPLLGLAHVDQHGGAFEVDACDSHAVGAAEREPLTGEREAPLRLFVFIGCARNGGRHPQFGVDNHAAPRGIFVVDVAVGVETEPDAHLWGGQANPWCGVHRLEHVGNELTDLVGNSVDGVGRCVKHGVAHDANRKNCHALTLAVSAAG